ncbi:MAG: SDR family NAD(P)-dependent oxidoreductase [Actinobacteria bacterium]|nr:SDR family NAD(P)-dependent oxidoreductase [Actinomycetota bacterium]
MGWLDGKVAIVTGAGRGIGRGEAILLAAEGARVVVNDLGTAREGDGTDRSPAQSVVDEITAAGGEAVATYDDVSTWKGAEATVARAVETYGRLDVLVNNAGILRDAMSFSMTEEQWDDVIRVHLKGHFATSHFACRYWRGQSKVAGDAPVGGRIVNTASESGLFGMAGQANYSAAKAGIASLTIVLAREMRKYGVTVNAIAPRARTRMTSGVPGADEFMIAKPGEYDEWSPDNVAPVVGFLASEAAADVSGQIFVVWGSHVYLMRGWSLVHDFDAGARRWAIGDLVAGKADLFAPAPRGSKIPVMGF